MNLIILTTAITRGQFHKKSIGKFYKLYNIFLKEFNIFHIINLDLPDKLKNKFSKNETINLFKDIIPKNVNTTLIDNDNPGFLNAYKNVVNKCVELNLKNNTLVWWFEDDWDVSFFNPFLFEIIKKFPTDKCFAFNSVRNSPLGSFRGGPIMTYKYFEKYFDIVSNNIVNNTCDPERQVSRWISGINRTNGHKKIHRNIKNDNTINIIFFYFNDCKINIKEMPNWYYSRENKYNKNLIFKYHAIKSSNLNDFEYGEVDLHNNVINFKKILFKDILIKLNNITTGINYICIKPYVFSDIGRQFNKINNLTKWSTINDGTSYV